MAFKKRDNQNILNNTENDNNIIEENIKFSNNEEVKNYREDAIRTIEILEKKGINIYDENRYAGMYLKKEITDFHRLDKIPKICLIKILTLIKYFHNKNGKRKRTKIRSIKTTSR